MNGKGLRMTAEPKSPATGTLFRLSRWRYLEDCAGVEFHFECDVFGAFRETVIFPGLPGTLADTRDEAQDRIVTLLHGALGPSYYKCAAAKTIRVESGPLDADGLAMLRALYGEGLGEFFVRNNLPYPYGAQVEAADPRDGDWAARTPAPEALKASAFHGADALVGYGGGKDSLVAMDIAEKAVATPRFFRVAVHKTEPTVIERPDDGMFRVDRFIDPALIAANEKGALNGHVPITAMNSLIALLAAKALDVKAVIFANERSADEGTALVDGKPVNHQFSKTFEMEKLIHGAVSAKSPDLPAYFSLLRPVSEVWIARHLAGLPQHHRTFMSCNRNFRIGNDGPLTWCGECPKCAFTYLLFTPFLEREALVDIFRSNLLDKASLAPIYEELVGLKPVKPWECVGTVEECRTLLLRLVEDPLWQDDAIVSSVGARLAQDHPEFDAEHALARLLDVHGSHNVPEPYWRALKMTGLRQVIGEIGL